MKRLSRMLKLIELLQSGRVLDAPELAEFLSVSRRTVFRDLASLQTAGFLVVLDSQRGGYHSPHRMALPPSELTTSEAATLCTLGYELAGTDCGIPFLDDARIAVRKIRHNLAPSARTAVEAMTEHVTIRLETHGTNALERSYFHIALRAAANRRRVRIECAPVRDEQSEQTDVDIYRLLFLGGQWLLVGLSSLHREVQRIPLSSLLKIEILPVEYTIPERFSLDRYLRNSNGAVRDNSAESLDAARRMRIDPAAAREDQDAGARVVEEIDDLRNLLNEFSNGLGPQATTHLKARIEDCIDRMRRVLSGSAATPSVRQRQE